MTQLSKSLGIYTRNQLSTLSDLAFKLGLTVPAEEDLPDMLGLPEDNMVAGLDMDEELSSFFEKTTSGLVEDVLATFKGQNTTETAPDGAATNGTNGADEAQPNAEAARPVPRNEYEELEALVAQSTSDYVKNTLNSMSPMSAYVPPTTSKLRRRKPSRTPLTSRSRRRGLASLISYSPPAQFVSTVFAVRTASARGGTTTVRKLFRG